MNLYSVFITLHKKEDEGTQVNIWDLHNAYRSGITLNFPKPSWAAVPTCLLAFHSWRLPDSHRLGMFLHSTQEIKRQ